MPRPPSTSRAEQAQARREEILDAALRLFAEQGFSATTTKQIAEAAGVREGLLYHYFPSKLGLLREVAQQRPSFGRGAIEILEGAERRPTHEVMTEIGARLVTISREEARVARMLLSEAQSNLELHATFNELFDQVAGALERYLEARIRAGELRRGLSARVAAHGFLGGFMMFFIRHQHDDPREWQKVALPFIHEWIDTWYGGASG